MRLMYDSTTIDAIPAGARLVAGYLDGDYPTYPQLAVRFPTATRVSITVTGLLFAQVADVETGDLSPASGARWAARKLERGEHPSLYCNLSTWPVCIRALQAIGLTSADASWWIAHYDDDPTIPPGAIAKQYSNDQTANLDTSNVAAYWPGIDLHPPTGDDMAALMRIHGKPEVWLLSGQPPTRWHVPDQPTRDLLAMSLSRDGVTPAPVLEVNTPEAGALLALPEIR